MAACLRRGFTLIELMIVVAIIGILAAVAIPKFADLIRKSGEGATMGNLNALRSAVSIYYGDMDGVYPSLLPSLTTSGKYLAAMPSAKLPSYHGDSSATDYGLFSALPGDGGWYYSNVAGDINEGQIVVDCTHTDTRGRTWSQY